MGKNTKIVASIVPLCFDGDQFDFAVTLTPRLPDSGYLSEYYEILHWYQYVKYFNKKIQIDFFRLPNFEHFPTNPVEASRINNDEKDVDKFWNKMFNKDTLVNGWILNELPYQLADSITQRFITEEIKKSINEVIENLMINPTFDSKEDPFLYDGEEDERRIKMASFSEYLEDLKIKKNVNQILNDPILLSTRFRPVLDQFYNKLKKINELSQQQRDDFLLRLSVAEIERRNFEETSEFHKKFSAYANHPYLLKKTGWIFQFSLKKPIGFNEGIIQINDKAFLISEEDPSLKNQDEKNKFLSFKQEIDFIFPYTSVNLNDNSNFIIAGKYPLEDTGFLEVDEKNGYLKLHSKNHKITAHQVDKAQILARIENILNTNFEPTNTNLAPNQRNTLNILQQESQNLLAQTSSSNQEYITSGISLDIENLKQIIETNINTQPDRNLTEKKRDVLSATEGSGIIYRHNLIAGFRVDVIGFDGTHKETFLKGSLCKKVEIYSIATNKKFGKYPNSDSQTDANLWKVYEGTLVESVQGSKSGKLYVDEELCRWNDSSLIAGDHGNYNDLDNTDEIDFSIKVEPQNNSIISLRFGWKYSFALRVADIIGYSQVPIDFPSPINDFNDDKLKAHLKDGKELINFWTSPIYYQRVEAVNSPLLLLGNKILKKDLIILEEPKKPPQPNEDNSDLKPDKKNLDKTDEKIPDWLDEHWGEDIITMVVKSEIDSNYNLVFNPKTETSRYLGPPKANWNFVVQHGVLDNFFKEISNNPISDAELESLKNEFLDAADTKIDKQVHKVITGGRLDFMYDPAVIGFEFIIDNLIFKKELPKASPVLDSIDRFQEFKFWKKKEYYRLLLTYDKLQVNNPIQPAPSYNFSDDKKGVFYLPKGFEQEIIIGCDLQDKIDATTTISTKNIFSPGIPQKRRFSIKLIHAVQKPCLITKKYSDADEYFKNEIFTSKFFASDRSPNSLTAYFHAEFDQFPVLTADTYILHVDYFNWVCDRKTEKGFRIIRVSKIAKSNFLPLDTTSENDVVFNSVEHIFDDTKFVMAQYKIEAVSKFKKYFKPNEAHETPRDFSIFALFKNTNYFPLQFDDDKEKERKGIFRSLEWSEYNYRNFLTNWLPIKSSKPPATPVIDKIVPLIRWDERDSQHIKRYCDTVRVYFEGDWYSSGADEKVVVFFMKQMNKNLNVEVDSGNILIPLKDKEIGYDNVISQFGLDPISTYIDFNDWDTYDWDKNPSSKFLLNYDAFDRSSIHFEYLPSPVPLEELDFEKPDQKNLAGLQTFGAIYPIHFTKKEDPESNEGKFYIDIQLNNDKIKQFYFPFVRFAIARYQEHAIPKNNSLDHRFSKVVVTDFVQLLPYRELKILDNLASFFAPSKRTINSDAPKYETVNELRILDEGNLSGENIFYILCDNPIEDGVAIKNSDKSEWYDINFPAQKNIMIAEYEVYTNQEGEEMEDFKETIDGKDIIKPLKDNQFPTSESDPQKNYLKRLVFSYIINRGQKAKITKNDKTAQKTK